MGGDRPRMQKPIVIAIIDKDVFTENCATKNAKLHIDFTDTLKTEIWLDKHYWDRLQFGDDDGERIGIDIEFVELLIIKSFKHLVYYSLKHKEFLFINHPPPKTRNIRVVLRHKFPDKTTLNVAVEYHFLRLNSYEVTVKTAMSKEDFNLGDGQYAIEFEDEESVLYTFRKNELFEVDSYSE